MMATRPPRGWLERNWPWAVAGGCLAFAIAIVVFIAAVALVATVAIKRSDAYMEAVGRAKESATVRRLLGEPVREGFLVSGSVRTDLGSGTAELSIPLGGPKGTGTLFVRAAKTAGQWSFSRLVVRIENTGEEIDLLTESRRL